MEENREKKISIIIPTYNRAHLLMETIPTYIQRNVNIIEIIIVDDCSKDNTKEVIEKLQKKYSIIRYYRLETNNRQQTAKNKGIELLNKECDYVYFGDDDSILLPNSLTYLIDTLSKSDVAMVGARALYARSLDDIKNYSEFIKKSKKSKNKKIVNFDKDIFDFDCEYEKPLEVPVTNAFFMIKKEIIGETRFDVRYKGNAYREETDFTLSIKKKVKKIMYDCRAIGINYPRNIATGGAHKKGIVGKIIWNYWAIKNNNIFLDKNYNYLKKINEVTISKNILKIKFIFIQIKRILKNIVQKLLLKIKIG
ncbi:putative glycosyltransferase [Fusobacterium varium]|nr:putative glycosyltransferase [Fusobacterium varium]